MEDKTNLFKDIDETELNLTEFENLIQKKSMFICGNGFSINFDSNFGKIFSILEQAKKYLESEKSYFKMENINEKFNKKYISSYDKTKKYFASKDVNFLFEVLSDAILFGDRLLKNEILIKEMNLESTTFGKSPKTILESIVNKGIKNGIEKINFEEITIFVFFYYKCIELGYKMDENNYFIMMMENIANDEDKEDCILERIMRNGFVLYYKMLFCLAIYIASSKKSIKKMDRYKKLKIKEIKSFLEKFDWISTLNYDSLLEQITTEKISHLHGSFTKKEEHVYGISMGVRSAKEIISFSDILIGDWNLKSFQAILYQLSSASKINKEIKYANKMIKKAFSEIEFETVVLFGMSVNNDEDVLRYIFLSTLDNKKPLNIVYCYFQDNERQEFLSTISKLITFSNEVNNFLQTNINFFTINTDIILRRYFQK